MCGLCAEMQTRLNALASALEQQNSSINLLLQEWQRAQIPRNLQQARLYVQSGIQINMAQHLQSQELLRVTAMIIVVSSAATLLVQERQIPITTSQFIYLGQNGWLIRSEDQFLLTQTNPGPLGLELLGEEMADRGRRW